MTCFSIFSYRTAKFYSAVLNNLTKYVTRNDKRNEILEKLTLTKLSFIEVFRLIIFHGKLKELENEK